MGRKRRQPKLRIARDKYYCADVYRPDGKRTTIGFGNTEEHSESEVYIAFGKWLELYSKIPQKVLSYSNPYEAIRQILNPSDHVTVKELLTKHRVYAENTVRKLHDNREHPDFIYIKKVEQVLTPYKDWPVKDFGPDELYAIQNILLNSTYKKGKKDMHYTRGGINNTIKWIRRIWKWGMGRHFVSAENLQGLNEVKPLRMGETNAPEAIKRKKVTQKEFYKVLENTGTVVGDMLELVWHTAMRPNEVCSMRPFDIITDDPKCWLYIPGRDLTPVGSHKTTQFERIKVIPLTRECQKILKPRIKNLNSKNYIFSPKETMKEFWANRKAKRKTPLKYGNSPGTNKKQHPMIKPNDKYDHHSLYRACKRACKKAGVEIFSPYDLRRTVATTTRSVLGKEAAKVLLGHTTTDTTDIYLLEEVQETIKVAKELERLLA